MRRLLHNPAIVWLCLLAATFISVEFIQRWVPGNFAMAVIMALAAAKATLVAWSFMGLASAPLAWRIAFATLFWLGAAMIVVLGVLG